MDSTLGCENGMPEGSSAERESGEGERGVG